MTNQKVFADGVLEIEEFSRRRITRDSPIRVGEELYNPDFLIDVIGPVLTDERRQRLSEVVNGRTYNFVPVLENPYDLGNISAVMRSSEAFGFLEMDLVVPPGSKFKSANRVARGADKWLDVQVFKSPIECVSELRGRGFQIFATHLDSTHEIDAIDFSRPTAVVMGNEKDGVSPDMLASVDGSFVVPMQGFSQSFNISVAAAIVFYHAWKERRRTLGASGDLDPEQSLQVLANYYLRCLDNPELILERAKATR